MYVRALFFDTKEEKWKDIVEDQERDSPFEGKRLGHGPILARNTNATGKKDDAKTKERGIARRGRREWNLISSHRT